MIAYRRLSPQGVILTIAVALVAAAFLALSRPTVMMVDGDRVASDVSPVTTANARVFVPIRAIADALGAQTFLDAKTGEVAIVRRDASLRLKPGTRHATLNGMPMTLSHAPFRVRGRTMVPLGLVKQAFGVRASYDPRRARIDVLTPSTASTTVR